MSPGFRPREIFGALERHEVDYVAVGGIALIAHGAIRATLDLDLMPDPSPRNLSRLAVALADLEATPEGDGTTPIDVALLDRDANTPRVAGGSANGRARRVSPAFRGKEGDVMGGRRGASRAVR